MPQPIQGVPKGVTLSPISGIPDGVTLSPIGDEPLPPDPSGRTPTGEPAQGDQRNSAQRWLDNLTTPDPRKEEWQSPFRNGVDDFAQHVASGFVPLISHPWESAKGLVTSVGHALADNAGSPIGAATDLMRPMAQKVASDYKQHGPIRGTADLLGTGAGMWAGGELGGEAAKPLSAIGEATERGGLNLGNAALGARGPKLFKYGANPARGAYEEGVLPAISKHSASMKLANALPQAGERVSNAVASGGNIPLGDIARSIESPVNEARGIIEGPGGGNRSIEPIEALRESMKRRAPGASDPIYGPQAGTPFTAEEALQKMLRPSTKLLPAPMEEVPLHSAGAYEGRLSEPVVLNQPDRPMLPALPQPRNISKEIPLPERYGVEPKSSPMAFPAERMPQKNISGFGTDSGVAGNLGRNYRELGSTTRTIPPRLTREAYLSGSEHPELSGHIPVSDGILRRFEELSNEPAQGMGASQYIGQIPGEMGGPGQVQGVLRRPQVFGASDQPIGLADLRHPYATAPDVWRTIQNLDKNTRFNPDPEVEGVNELRRGIRGGLRGNLEEAVPGLKPISQRYADLKGAEEALDRTMHSGSGLSKMVKIPMFPIESGVGKAMFRGGQGMQLVSPFARAGIQSAPVATLMNDPRKKKE